MELSDIYSVNSRAIVKKKSVRVGMQAILDVRHASPSWMKTGKVKDAGCSSSWGRRSGWIKSAHRVRHANGSRAHVNRAMSDLGCTNSC